MAVKIRLDVADTEVEVVSTIEGADLQRHRLLGVLLDGHYMGDVTTSLNEAQDGLVVELDLPTHTVAHELDLVDIGTSESILRSPYDLALHYRFCMLSFAVQRHEAVGHFSIQGLGKRAWIQFGDEKRTFFRGFAIRQAGDDGMEYHFRLPLLSLVPPNEPSIRRFLIAGKQMPNVAIPLQAIDIGYVGFVDVSIEGYIVGWALNLQTPSKRVAVDLLLEGEVVGTTHATEFRDDLRQAGISDGASGFTFDLSGTRNIRDQQLVSVFVSGTRLEICNSPVVAFLKASFRGSFDTLHGMSAHGWALDNQSPETPVLVEAVCDGRVLAQASANLFRSDLLDFGLNGGFCAFKIEIGPQILDLIGKELFVRIVSTGMILEGSPKVPAPNRNVLKYLRENRDVTAAVLPRLKQFMNYKMIDQSVSIIMPVYNTPRDWLVEALTSVRNQWCDHWELICIDDCSTELHVRQVLQEFSEKDSRIRVINAPHNGGIAKAVNLGLRTARADYVTFLDHDDYLEPDAVFHLLRGAKETRADFIYSDEVTTEENIQSISEVKARPAFSYDFYLSHPYFVHMLCLRRELVLKIGGWDERMAISGDVDFVLRCLELADTIVHIPRVLYRWRTHGTSTGHSKKETVMEATRSAIQRHLDRRQTGAIVEDGVWFNQFRINWPGSEGRVLIVIPTKNKADLVRVAVDSIERTSIGVDYKIVVVDHESDEVETQNYLKSLATRHSVMTYTGDFNYSRINNLAVEMHGADCPFVLFLNNDIEAIQNGWISRMRSLVNREDVGAVGALLLYPDKRIQHAGVIMGFNGSADHAFKFEDAYLDANGRRNLGLNCSLTSVRDYSAVTAACLMMRTSVYQRLGGFDETFGVGFNDTDLCLRVREAGLKVLYDGNTILFHFESATRSQSKLLDHPEDRERLLARHGTILNNAEPFYSPNLSHVAQDHVLREDSGCKKFKYRATSLLALHPSVDNTSKTKPKVRKSKSLVEEDRSPRRSKNISA